MQLDEYLFRTKQSRVKFAQRLGITAPYLCHIVSGRVSPSVRLAKRIEDETKGMVGWVDLIDFAMMNKKRNESNDNVDLIETIGD